MNKITGLAIKDLKANKKRNFLTIVSITISVFLICIILLISSSFHKKMIDEMKISDEDVLHIAFGNKENTLNYTSRALFTEEDVNWIKEMNGVKNVTGVKSLNVSSIETEGGKQLITTYLSGVNDEYAKNVNIVLKEGKMPNGDNEVIIGDSVRESSDLKVGDFLYVEAEGENLSFRVVGIINRQKEQAFSTLPAEINQMIAISEESKYLKNKKYEYISARATDVKEIETVSKNIVKKLEKDKKLMKSLDGTGFSVIVASRVDVLNMLDRWFKYINIFIFILAVLIGVISTINIINIMIISVREKYKDIVIFKIVGAKDSQVSSIFIKQSLIMGVLGSSIGIIFGSAISCGATMMLSWPKGINFGMIVLAFLMGVITSTISGVMVSRKVEKLEISMVLNEE